MRALVFLHAAHETLGLLEPAARANGIELTRVRLWQRVGVPDPSGYDALIVMGGPMGVYQEVEYPWLKEENLAIQRATEKGVPYLGICLGGQLLAKALNAEVRPNHTKEIGFDTVELTREGTSSPLFQGFQQVVPVFQWHGDTFAIPKGASALATGSACLNQAFSYRGKAFALQFHVEVTPKMVDTWLKAGMDEVVQVAGQGAPQYARRVLRQAHETAETFRQNTRLLFDNFIRIVQEG